MIDINSTSRLCVRVGALQGYSSLLEKMGRRPEPLLKEQGLTLEMLDHPELMIPYASFESLLHETAEALNMPDFGLQLGASQDLLLLGDIGSLMLHSQSLSQAMNYARNYASLHVRAEYWAVEEDEANCYITRYQHQRTHNYKRQNVELSLAACYRIIQLLVGPDFNLQGVHFTHQPISSLSHYRSFFSSRVSFNQERDMIYFSREYLKKELKTFDQDTEIKLRSIIDSKLGAIEIDIEEQTRSLILASLGQDTAMLDHIAKLLNLHPRTLQRRLLNKGTNFKNLVLDTKMETARWVLHNSQMSITQLSNMLGYSDTSAFSKAFKVYHGQSPKHWRATSSRC